MQTSCSRHEGKFWGSGITGLEVLFGGFLRIYLSQIKNLAGTETHSVCCFFRQTRLSLSELLTTETELRAMAAAAYSGLSRMPKKG